MTTFFRMILILVSGATFWVLNRKIRKSRIRIEETVFWILLSLLFVLFALFPALADRAAAALGIYSTPNFLFLFIIFLLLLRLFHVNMQLGRLEEKLRTLAQEFALSQNREREEESFRDFPGEETR